MSRRWLVNLAYYGCWLLLAAVSWLLARAIFHVELTEALLMTVFVLPMLLLSGYRDDIADHLAGRCPEMTENLWQLQPGDRSALPGSIRWNSEPAAGLSEPICRSYVLDSQLIIFNASLYDLAGFLTETEFTRCMELTFPAACANLTVGIEQKKLIRRLACWARSEDEVVFAGCVINLNEGVGRAYLYYQPRHARAMLRKAGRILLRNGFAELISDSSDPEWNNYLHSLIPDETTFRHLYNIRQSTGWRCRGVDVNQSRLLYFQVRLNNSHVVEPGSSELAAFGYKLQRCGSPGHLTLSKSIRLDPDTLNATTGELQTLLDKFNGRLESYTIGEETLYE